MGKEEKPIGIFDSGAGGISLLRRAAIELPNEDFIYFGDSGNAPYGTRTVEEIRMLALGCAKRLLAEGVKLIVVACNTASSAAVTEIRANISIPIVAMEPALKPAMSLLDKGGVIVMATPATLKQKMFLDMVAEIGDGDRVIKLPCPELVELIEGGQTNADLAVAAVERTFKPYRGRDIDAIVLGCTHFLFAKKAIGEAAGHLLTGKRLLVDGHEGTLMQLKKVLARENLQNPKKETGKIRFLTSSRAEGTLALYRRLFKFGE
ncbi:MAG: glutamate racemase [Bacillota bacterium]|nr:glutamate racemase [Bacillota bacterium]